MGIPAGSPGYLQRIEPKDLIHVADARDLLVRIDRRPGEFVLADDVILRAWPADRVDGRARESLSRTFAVGRQRSHSQDVEFAVDQLVEIALLALSPGINDSFTEMMCIDRLAEGISRFAERRLPSPYRSGSDGTLRVIAHPVNFATVLGGAFDQIRQNSRGNVAVLHRLLTAMRDIAARTEDADRWAGLRDHARVIHEEALKSAQTFNDRRSIDEAYHQFLAASAQAADPSRH